MNKEQLHSKLSKVFVESSDSVTITDQEFTDVYGNKREAVINGVSHTRADILANVYSLSVEKQGSDYVFTRSAG